MPLLIPVAENKTGETVTPTCSKDDGPFTCLGCSKPLVLRQGEKNRWHFAHHAKDNDECSAGGETYIHLAAKLLLVTYITRFEFFAHCGSLRHVHERGYRGCTAVQEHRYDGVHSADVGVLRDEKLEAIIGVMATHKTEEESLASRMEFVGEDNVWEVEAMRVLKQQRRLTLTTDTIRLPSLLRVTDCTKCAQASREAHERWVKQMAVEKLESEERRRQFEEQQADTTVVLVDENTLRRNGVLMKKIFFKPGDSIDRSYGWMKAPEASP
ncbi:unnamed protein product [Ectocarpus sp. 12 AP-2014]